MGGLPQVEGVPIPEGFAQLGQAAGHEGLEVPAHLPQQFGIAVAGGQQCCRVQEAGTDRGIRLDRSGNFFAQYGPVDGGERLRGPHRLGGLGDRARSHSV